MAVCESSEELFFKLCAGVSFKLLESGGLPRGDLFGEFHILRVGKFFEILAQRLVIGDERFGKGFHAGAFRFLNAQLCELCVSMTGDGGILDEPGFGVRDQALLVFGLACRGEEKRAAQGEREGRQECGGAFFHELGGCCLVCCMKLGGFMWRSLEPSARLPQGVETPN